MFLALAILYPNDRLPGFVMATKTCRAAKLYQRPLNSMRSLSVLYYLPSTFTPIGKRAFIFISPCSPEAKLDFVTKLSHIHGNIMRTNQMTGNIIVSTCCLGDMAVNAPSSSGCALGHGGVYSHITLANMS